MEFFDPSPRATGEVVGRFAKKYNFPFAEVPKGKSFSVPKEAVKNLNVLRTTASRMGKRMAKKFKVIEHETEYEVYCVPDVVGFENPLTGCE